MSTVYDKTTTIYRRLTLNGHRVFIDKDIISQGDAFASHKFATTANSGNYNSLIKLNSDEYALAYSGEGGDGYVKTYTISANGETINPVWSMEHDLNNGTWNELILIDKNTYALSYTGNGSDGYIKTFDIVSGDVTGPAISNSTIAYDNSTVSLLFNEGVYNTNANSGALEVSDFVISKSGGTATLTSATPTSIAVSSGYNYTLGLALTGTPNGSEVITVVPAQNAIFDANGTASSTTQSNNTVNPNEKVLPIITATAMADDNTTVNVTFSEAVFAAYGNGAASGDLAVSDFVYSLSGGEATLVSTTPSSIIGPGSFTSIGEYNGHTYYRSNSSATYTTAKTACENAGGTLVVITSAGENDFIKTNLGYNHHIWIGLTDEADEGTYVWATGESFGDYVNWSSGQPDAAQDYGGMYYHTGYWWDDYGTSGYNYYYVLEIPSLSPTLTSVYTLGVDYAGLPNRYEELTVVPVEDAIYDAAGNVASTTQSNNKDNFSEENIRKVAGLEHNTTQGTFNSFVKVDSNTYALAYSGHSNDGYIQTFTIPTSGSSITKVTTVEHDNNGATYASIVQVDADTYVSAYYGYYGGWGGQIRTFTIPVDGSAVTTVNTLRHYTSTATWNSLIALDADTYVLAFTDANNDGWLKTFTVSADGATLTQVATLEHDLNNGEYNSLVKVDANTVALAYTSSSNWGYIKTFTIPADGSSITEVNSYKHDGIQGKYNSFVQADSNTYVLAYAGSGNDGLHQDLYHPLQWCYNYPSEET